MPSNFGVQRTDRRLLGASVCYRSCLLSTKISPRLSTVSEPKKHFNTSGFRAAAAAQQLTTHTTCRIASPMATNTCVISTAHLRFEDELSSAVCAGYVDAAAAVNAAVSNVTVAVVQWCSCFQLTITM